MSYIITNTEYIGSKNLVLIQSSNDNILNDNLFISKYPDYKDTYDLTLVSKGVYKPEKNLSDGVWIIYSKALNHAMSPLIVADNCEKPIEIFYSPLPSDCSDYARLSAAQYLTEGRQALWFDVYGGSCYCSPDRIPYSQAWFTTLTSNDRTDFYNNVPFSHIFYYIVIDSTSGCVLYYCRKDATSGNVSKLKDFNLRYDCKEGIQYSDSAGSYYSHSCPSLPPAGTKLKNGKYNYCLYIINDRERPTCCTIQKKTLTVRCSTPNEDAIPACTKQESDYFEYTWEQNGFCFKYIIENKGYDMKIDLLYTNKKYGSCNDISKNKILHSTIYKTKNDKNFEIYPYDDPTLALNYFPVIIRIKILDTKGSCVFDICANKCALPLVDDNNQLRGVKVSKHKIDGEYYLNIHNPIGNGFVRFNGLNVDNTTILGAGTDTLMKHDNSLDYLRYSISSIDNLKSITTTVNIPETTEAPKGLFYYKSNEGSTFPSITT